MEKRMDVDIVPGDQANTIEMEDIAEEIDSSTDLSTVLTLLLPYMEKRDWGSLRAVCHDWNIVILSKFQMLQSLKMQDFIGISDKKGLDLYEWIDTYEYRMRNFVEYVVKRYCKKLTSLQFFDDGFAEGWTIKLQPTILNILSEVAPKWKLKTINFTGVRVPSVESLNKFLQACPKTETLILRNTLRLVGWAGTTNETNVLRPLSAMTSLKYLDVSGARWIRGRILENFPISLETLIMDGTRPTCRILVRQLGRLTNLHTLAFDSGVTAALASVIVQLPNLESLIMNGITKWSFMGISAAFTPGRLHTLCLGPNIKRIDPSGLLEFFRDDRTKATLAKLEFHSKNFATYTNNVQMAFEAIGGLINLEHLELSLLTHLEHYAANSHMDIVSSTIILENIFKGCKKLETLAMKYGYPVDGVVLLPILREIGRLESLKDLSWIMARAEANEQVLDIFCQELGGRLKRLRCGSFINIPTVATTPHLVALAELIHLDLVLDMRYNIASTENDLMSLLDILKDSLKSLRTFNSGPRKRMLNCEVNRISSNYPDVEVSNYHERMIGPGTILAGGSMTGIRKNVKSISFARTGKDIQGF